MSAFIVRTAGPALVVVVEVEAPTRMISTAATPAEEARLRVWLDEDDRHGIEQAALADRARSGGVAAQLAWRDALAADIGFGRA